MTTTLCLLAGAVLIAVAAIVDSFRSRRALHRERLAGFQRSIADINARRRNIHG